MSFFRSAKTKRVKTARRLTGSVPLPGDKSISHRYAMLAAIAEGTTRIRNYSTGADCQSTLEVVARFLALLELYREGMVSFDQVTALGELTVRWTGADDAEASFSFEDEYEPEPEPAASDEPAEGVEPVVPAESEAPPEPADTPSGAIDLHREGPAGQDDVDALAPEGQP